MTTNRILLSPQWGQYLFLLRAINNEATSVKSATLSTQTEFQLYMRYFHKDRLSQQPIKFLTSQGRGLW